MDDAEVPQNESGEPICPECGGNTKENDYEIVPTFGNYFTVSVEHLECMACGHEFVRETLRV